MGVEVGGRPDRGEATITSRNLGYGYELHGAHPAALRPVAVAEVAVIGFGIGAVIVPDGQVAAIGGVGGSFGTMDMSIMVGIPLVYGAALFVVGVRFGFFGSGSDERESQEGSHYNAPEFRSAVHEWEPSRVGTKSSSAKKFARDHS